MTRREDPVRSLLSPLRSRWERSEHRNRLESELMRTYESNETSRARRLLPIAAACLGLGLAAAAFPAVRDWWEGWTAEETTLEDGHKRLVVTDPDGRIDFDEVLEASDEVFMTEDGEYFILEPEDDPQAETGLAPEEPRGDGRD